MNKWEDDIRRYLSGEMSSQEQHALEKKALRDPFLYEALEGAGIISRDDFSEDLKDLTSKINKRTQEVQHEDLRVAASAMKPIPEGDLPYPSESKLKNKTHSQWIWPMRIAASVALMALVYFAITPLLEGDKQLAQQTSKPQEENISTDTLPQQAEAPIVLSDSKVSDQSISKSKKARKAMQPAEETAIQPPVAAEQLIDEEIKSGKEKITETQIAEIISESPVVASETDRMEAKKEAAEPARAKGMAHGIASNQKVIQGHVSSAEDGTPLPGVNIVVKGTTTGTVTDIQGHYKLFSNTPDPTLVYSFIGLQTQEVKATDQHDVNVNLHYDVSQLSEVVVTGYSPVKDEANYEPVVKLAEPVGGRRAYDKYLKNSLQYPQQALDNQIKGRVTVQFTVRKDGSLDEFNVLKGLGYGCDEEVIRLVKDGPKWSPTTEDDVPVESEVRVRVKFALPD